MEPGMRDLTDEELNAYILTRLRLIGVDIGVLPEDDADAPADQRRVLASARNLLRNTVPVISDFVIDVQEVPPMLYPAGFTSWQR
jgi:hypothetical protein